MITKYQLMLLLLLLSISSQIFGISFEKQDDTILFSHGIYSVRLNTERILSLSKGKFNNTDRFLSFLRHHKTIINCTNDLHVSIYNVVFDINIYFIMIVDSFNNTENELKFKSLGDRLDKLDNELDKIKHRKFQMISGKVDFIGDMIVNKELCRFKNCVCSNGKSINGYDWYNCQWLMRGSQNCSCTINFTQNVIFDDPPKILFNVPFIESIQGPSYIVASYFNDFLIQRGYNKFFTITNISVGKSDFVVHFGSVSYINPFYWYAFGNSG